MRYPSNTFRVCYFTGTDPTTGAYLGTETEPVLDASTADRGFGIDREWGQNEIFNGRFGDISAVWRGDVDFSGGDYLFTVVANDGVRVYLDEDATPIVDEWDNQGTDSFVVTQPGLTAGLHKIRVEWYEGARSELSLPIMQLYWDKAPDLGFAPVISQVDINVYLITSVDTCIVGKPWDGASEQAKQLNIKDSTNGSIAYTWQYEGLAQQDRPRGLKPSDPTFDNLDPSLQSECFTFAFKTDSNPALDEIEDVKGLFEKYAAEIDEWSFGSLAPTLHFTELAGEFEMDVSARLGVPGLILSWANIEEVVSASNGAVTRQTDFVLATSAIRDLQRGNFHQIPYCGGTTGIGSRYLRSGTGYGWMAGPGSNCLEGYGETLYLHEWEHEVRPVIEALMEPIEGPAYPNAQYPACGNGVANTFRWYPEPDDASSDPDSPWCGRASPGERGLFAHNVLHHYDPSLSQYGLAYFTGNHCDNRKEDHGEDGVDSGDVCPPGGDMPPTITITSPPNSTTVPEGTELSFMATADDPEDGILTDSITWNSSLEGALDPFAAGGTPGSFNYTLIAGVHLITASVTDSNTTVRSKVIQITVEAPEPTPKPKPCRKGKC